MRPLFRNRAFLCLILLLGLLAISCNLTASNAASGESATQTHIALINLAGGTATVGGNNPPATSEAPAANTVAAPTDTTQPTNTSQPSDTPYPTATNTITHLTIPGNSTGSTRSVTDMNSSTTAASGRAPGGDNYQLNRYERPFHRDGMAYLQDVDILAAKIKIDSPWVYLTITIKDNRQEGIGQTMYGVEFDTNRDGRGEYLIWGASPAGTTWTTDGVEVWSDPDHDVGGPNPVSSNAPFTGNGYDNLVFSGGQGSDPDLAWIRRGSSPDQINVAFKYSAIGSATAFLWNAWADFGVKKPAWFDYNDHFTQDEAGSPLTELTKYFPLKSLFGVDNTCRDYFGFTPTGTEPGLCLYYGSITGSVWFDQNSNGVWDAGETALSGGTVTLGSGACPSAGLKSALTAASGAYGFTGLTAPGTYCVSYILGAWQSNTTSNPVTVHLGIDQNKVVNFGVYYLPPPA